MSVVDKSGNGTFGTVNAPPTLAESYIYFDQYEPDPCEYCGKRMIPLDGFTNRIVCQRCHALATVEKHVEWLVIWDERGQS